jgi:mannan endo-1,4-beta-mannosidase
MGDNRSNPPLARRVPGATRAAPGPAEWPVPPEALLQRMQAVVTAAHAQAAEEQRLASDEEARHEQALTQDQAARQSPPSLRGRGQAVGNGTTSLPGAEPAQSVSSRASWSNADDDTSPLPRLTASGAVASPDLVGVEPDRAGPPHGNPRPGHALKRDSAAKRERHAAKRERAARPGRAHVAEHERSRQERQRAAKSERQRAAELERHRAAGQERMKPRLQLLVAVAIACASITFSIHRLAISTPSPARATQASSAPPAQASAPTPPTAHLGVFGSQGVSGSGAPVADASLPTGMASYLGVYETGPPRTYRPVGEFVRAAGRRPNLVEYYSGWGQHFQTSFARAVRRHGGVTILQMDPTDASVPAIVAGDYDGYLRSFAQSVRKYGGPVVIGFGHEMNATWYSWGYGHVPPRTFVAAWRHIVTLFRGQGADNVTWLWTINTDLRGTGPVAAWWPGAGYVTWVGIDGYYSRPSDTFASVFGQTIAQVRAFTSKPVLLSETAVRPEAGQAAKIGDLFAGMRQYQTLGLVWFDVAQHHGIHQQNWRIENSRAALAAFRHGASALRLAHP